MVVLNNDPEALFRNYMDYCDVFACRSKVSRARLYGRWNAGKTYSLKYDKLRNLEAGRIALIGYFSAFSFDVVKKKR